LVTADDVLYIRYVSESSHGCIFYPLKPKRQREGKDRWKSRFKEETGGEVRDTLFSKEGVGEEHQFVRRFPGYARSSFWKE
jgi:hypothetical protein